jgi:erythronate-4-phosphate dehydrogenase
MRIAVDTNIPLAEPFFSPWGEIQRFEGRTLQTSDLVDIDVLMVRSVTKVNASLLKNSNVQFVGTATAGTDHIDARFLEENQIRWASAPGSNSWSVADYVTVVFAKLLAEGELDKKDPVGVIGYGHVGSKVAERLRHLGLVVHIYDPVHRDAPLHPEWQDWESILNCKAISLHTPLTREGNHPTFRWLNRDALLEFKPGLILVNTSRGEVCLDQDLIDLKKQGHLRKIFLDVFENEPRIEQELLDLCDLRTPHIAGYSWTGKIRGTQMLAEQLNTHFGPRPSALWSANAPIELNVSGLNLDQILIRAYDPWADQQRWIESSSTGENTFDRMRKNYPKRWEFSDYMLLEAQPELRLTLKALGFQIKD